MIISTCTSTTYLLIFHWAVLKWVLGVCNRWTELDYWTDLWRHTQPRRFILPPAAHTNVVLTQCQAAHSFHLNIYACKCAHLLSETTSYWCCSYYMGQTFTHAALVYYITVLRGWRSGPRKHLFCPPWGRGGTSASMLSLVFSSLALKEILMHHINPLFNFVFLSYVRAHKTTSAYRASSRGVGFLSLV